MISMNSNKMNLRLYCCCTLDSVIFCCVFFPCNTSILRYNQINAIGTACRMGLESCRELTKSWYRKWMENPRSNPWVELRTVLLCLKILCSQCFQSAPSILSRIHPNLKSTVYCSAIAFGGVEEWEFAWRMFKTATLASEASRLRSAMSCTKIPWLLNR